MQMSQNPSFEKILEKEGFGDLAQIGQQVKFHYQLRVAESNEEISTSLDQPQSPITALLGSDEILPTIEQALLTMKMGENSTFNLEGKSFLKDGLSHELIQEDSNLILEIELTNLQDYNKPKWELNSKERLEYALQQKAEGNAYFKNKEFKVSGQKYQDGYQSIKDDTGEEYDQLKESLLMNSAMAFLKLKEYAKCIEYSIKALDLNPRNFKAYYRLSSAQNADGQHDRALQNAKKGLQLKPSSKDFQKLIKNIKAKKKKAEKVEKNFYKGMFGGGK